MLGNLCSAGDTNDANQVADHARCVKELISSKSRTLYHRWKYLSAVRSKPNETLSQAEGALRLHMRHAIAGAQRLHVCSQSFCSGKNSLP